MVLPAASGADTERVSNASAIRHRSSTSSTSIVLALSTCLRGAVRPCNARTGGVARARLLRGSTVAYVIAHSKNLTHGKYYINLGRSVCPHLKSRLTNAARTMHEPMRWKIRSIPRIEAADRALSLHIALTRQFLV